MTQSRTSPRGDLVPCVLPTALLPTTRLVVALSQITCLTDCSLGTLTDLAGLTPRDRVIQMPALCGLIWPAGSLHSGSVPPG